MLRRLPAYELAHLKSPAAGETLLSHKHLLALFIVDRLELVVDDLQPRIRSVSSIMLLRLSTVSRVCSCCWVRAYDC